MQNAAQQKGQRTTHILIRSFMTHPWPPEVKNAPLPSLARQGEPSFNQINKFICHQTMKQCHTKGGKQHADKPDTPEPPRPCLSNILPEPTPDQNRPPPDPSQPPPQQHSTTCQPTAARQEANNSESSAAVQELDPAINLAQQGFQ